MRIFGYYLLLQTQYHENKLWLKELQMKAQKIQMH